MIFARLSFFFSSSTARASALVLLVHVAGIGSAQELLRDGDLESSKPDGTFPSSGFWRAASLGEGGAVCVSPGRTGTNAFLLYTGNATNDSWSAPFQEVAAAPAQSFRGSAWIRKPADQPWLEGSRALARVLFLDAATNVLASWDSPAFAEGSALWQGFDIVTDVAPTGTALVRFACVLEKPAGAAGVSGVAFDDCSLLLVSPAPGPVSPQELVKAGNLESSLPDGNFPNSGFWQGAWLGQAGAICISPGR